jgi:hypothetical protein
VPKEVSEVSSGGQFSRSSNEGQLADSQTRSYKIIKSSVDEVVNIQEACQVRIGDQHPFNTNLYCVSFDARFEGDSRLVIAVTFNYQSTPSAGASGGGGDPRSQPPDVRPPDWTTSSSLMEVPANTWRKRIGQFAWEAEGPAVNSAKDQYDGVTKLAAIVTISVSVFEPTDPTTHNLYAGYINKDQLKVGSLTMPPHTVMFRGVSSQPAAESWGDLLYSGWRASYEFVFKPNPTAVDIAGAPAGQTLIGWDIAVPQSGLSVITFDPTTPNINQDPFGQPLKFDDDGAIDENPLALPPPLVPGKKARAMVVIPFSKKSSLNQSASPIPLNDDGTPRDKDSNPPVLVYAYAVQPEADFKALFPRLQFK